MANFTKNSRYRGGKEYTFNDTTVVYERDVNLSNIVRYYAIPAGHEFRPDLISLAVYKRADLGWVIMRANNLHHISELTVNRSLSIPEISGII